MKNLTVENVYTRQSAKELTRKHFWRLLGMMAIAVGIPYAMMMAVTTLTNPLSESQPALFTVLTLVLTLAVSLATCGLTLGMKKAMIDLARGHEEVPVGTVFSLMGYTLKAFGQGLWTGLKTFLWMLPGYLVMIVGAVLSYTTSTTTAPEDSAGMTVLVMFGGMILLFALIIPAAYRYMMAPNILADKPETGVFQSVRESKAMMKGHKWQCFKLTVPVALVMLVVMLVISVALGALTALLGNTAAGASLMSIVMMIVTFAASMYYTIRINMCYAVFYVKRAAEAEPAPAEETAEAPYME